MTYRPPLVEDTKYKILCHRCGKGINIEPAIDITLKAQVEEHSKWLFKQIEVPAKVYDEFDKKFLSGGEEMSLIIIKAMKEICIECGGTLKKIYPDGSSCCAGCWRLIKE